MLSFGKANLSPWGSWAANPVANLILNPTTSCHFTDIFKPGQEIIAENFFNKKESQVWEGAPEDTWLDYLSSKSHPG